MAVLRESCFDIELGYMTYCCSRELNCLLCTFSSFSDESNVGELSDVPLYAVSSSGFCNADGKSIGGSTLPASPVIFVSEESTSSQMTQAQVPL